MNVALSDMRIWLVITTAGICLIATGAFGHFTGSSGDGFDKNSAAAVSLDGDVVGHFTGGSGDGFKKNNAAAVSLNGEVIGYFAGGSGDGFKKNNAAAISLNGEVIGYFAGGSGDGFDENNAAAVSLNGDMIGYFAGGLGDGFVKNNAAAVSLYGDVIGHFDGGLGDGYDHDKSLAITLRGFDTSAPVLNSFTLATPATSLTNANTLIFLATFSEDVMAVDTAEFEVSGSATTAVTTVTSLTASTYQITVSGGDLASFSGPVGINLTGEQDITDISTNVLPAGEPPTDEIYILDNIAPEVVISSTAPDPTNTSSIPYTLTFSEAVTGIVESEIAFNNATISIGSLTTSNNVSWSFSVTPIAEGLVTVTIPEAVAVDAAGNNNTASSPFSINATHTIQETQLFSGWNHISLHVHPVDQDPGVVFAELIKFERLLRVFGEQKNFDPRQADERNTLDSITAGTAYWVEVTIDTTLSVSGSVLDPRTMIALKSGWNSVGYFLQSTADVRTTLKDLINVVDPANSNLQRVVGRNQNFNPNFSETLNTLKVLSLGSAYWIKVREDDKFQYREY